MTDIREQLHELVREYDEVESFDSAMDAADFLTGTIMALRAMAASKWQVWYLAIDHRHGTDITVHLNQDDALDALYGYVEYNWAEEMDCDREIPDDIQTAIDEYFEEMADSESYILADTIIER